MLISNLVMLRCHILASTLAYLNLNAMLLHQLRKNMDNKGYKCIFLGYSKDTKSYKIYDPIARKVIINRDVQFMDNEAWDGSIENTIIFIDVIAHDDTKEEVIQKPSTIQCAVPSITVTQIPVQTTLIRSTGAESTPTVQQTPTSSPSSSTSLDPTLASLLSRKKITLHDIYNEDTTNSFYVFSLFSQIDDPLTFEEVVKDDVWEQAMDE
jgi:hypothetical protein